MLSRAADQALTVGGRAFCIDQGRTGLYATIDAAGELSWAVYVHTQPVVYGALDWRPNVQAVLPGFPEHPRQAKGMIIGRPKVADHAIKGVFFVLRHSAARDNLIRVLDAEENQVRLDWRFIADVDVPPLGKNVEVNVCATVPFREVIVVSRAEDEAARLLGLHFDPGSFARSPRPSAFVCYQLIGGAGPMDVGPIARTNMRSAKKKATKRKATKKKPAAEKKVAARKKPAAEKKAAARKKPQGR